MLVSATVLKDPKAEFVSSIQCMMRRIETSHIQSHLYYLIAFNFP